MDNDTSPGLSVGFAVDTGGSYEALLQLERAMDATESKLLPAAARIERATASMVDMERPTIQLTTFANAATRELQTLNREKAQSAKIAEALIRQLDREAAALGRTKQEMLEARVAQTALALSQQGGNSDVLDRLDAASRNRAMVAAAIAEDQAKAADIAAKAVEREAQAVRDAAGAYNAFELAARNGMAVYREQQAAQAAVSAAAEAQARREAAGAYNAFELAARRGVQAMREAEAAARATAAAEALLAKEADQVRAAMDPMFAAQQRFDAEMERAERLLAAGKFGQQEYSRAVQMARDDLYAHAKAVAGSSDAVRDMDDHLRRSVAGSNNYRQAMAGASYQVQDFVTQVSMGANPVTAFVVQGGQLAGQFMNVEGAAGSVARFMMGGWGLALQIGLMALAPVVSKLWEADEAAKAAEAGMRQFQARQMDIGRFIDATTGRLKEQNATLVRNAILLRQSTIDKNAAESAQTRAKAFGAARAAMGDDTPVYTAGMVTQPRVDPAIRAVIKAAGADVQKLDAGLQALNKRRPDLKATTMEVSTAAARAVDLARENAKLSGEIDQLNGKTVVQGRVTASLIEKQVALATATTPLARARAQLALVQERAAAADKAGGAALSQFRTDLTGATNAVNAAEAAQKAAADGTRDARKAANAAQREAIKSAKDLLKSEKEIFAWALQHPVKELAIEAPGEAQRKAFELSKQAFKNVFGDQGDPMADAANAYHDQLKAKWEAQAQATQDLNDSLRLTATLAGQAGNALERAFGRAGSAVGDMVAIFGQYGDAQAEIDRNARTEADRQRASRALQLDSLIGLTGAAKTLFKEQSTGYKALEAAEKALAVVRAVSTVRDVAAGAARMFASLGPLGFPAVAAMAAVMAGFGVSVATGGSGKVKPIAANTGTGTVLGDSAAKSESIKRAIDQLRDVDTLMLSHSREMAASLRSIDRQIGGFAAQILKAGDINASAGVQTGFKTDLTGKVLSSLVDPLGIMSKIPVIGGVFSAVKSLIGSLFGSKTQITGTGLYGGAQSLGGILSSGFDAQNYTDVKKTKKFLGITTGTSYSTQYSGADAGLENQFTLILRSFNDAIAAAAGPLGESTDAIQQRLNGFIVNIGKIDLTGLSGEQITEKLTAVFGAAADQMASAAFPGVARFQKAGEGLFETAVRVASTLETVGASLDMLGTGSRRLSMDAKLGIADQFDSLSALTTAADGYFKAYYTSAEQAAAQTARFATVFDSLGMAMPDTLAGFRALVEAQDLTTAAGQSTYATLLQLAPAFADLKSSMTGVKSAADITSERLDLERQLLELRGDTAAIRALDLAKLDVSNRALQQQVWAVQDAQKAADAADQLRQAWTSVGDSIADEVTRIRGLSSNGTEGGFAVLQGRFNAATTAARGGDQDAAKMLPGLSQALLAAAANVATSRQELARVQAMTASSLEATKAAIDAMPAAPSATSTAALLAAAANTQAASAPPAAANDTASSLADLRTELAATRTDLAAALALIAANTGKVVRTLDNVTGQSGGDAVSVVQQAA